MPTVPPYTIADITSELIVPDIVKRVYQMVKEYPPLADQLLGVERTNSQTVQYPKRYVKPLLAEEMARGTEPRSIMEEYGLETITLKRYGIAFDYDIEVLEGRQIPDVVEDASETMVNAFKNRREVVALKEITNFDKYSDSEWGIQKLSTPGTKWDSGGSPFDDLLNAVEKFQDHALTKPDTLLVSPPVYTTLLKDEDIRDTLKYTGKLLGGNIPSILDMDVVSVQTLGEDGKNILGDNVVLMKRGRETGVLLTWPGLKNDEKQVISRELGLKMWMVYDPTLEFRKIMMTMHLGAHLYRPYNITVIPDVLSG